MDGLVTRIPLAILVLLFGALSYHAQAPADEEDLSGTWQMVEMIFKGQVQDPANGGIESIKIEKEKWFSTHNGFTKRHEVRIVLRSDKKPKEIDIIPIGKKDTAPFPGIYEVKDGKLRIIYAERGAGRPTEFNPAKNNLWTMYTLNKPK